MAEFGTTFSYSMHTIKLGYKPLSTFFSCQFRPQALDMARDFARSTLR